MRSECKEMGKRKLMSRARAEHFAKFSALQGKRRRHTYYIAHISKLQITDNVPSRPYTHALRSWPRARPHPPSCLLLCLLLPFLPFHSSR